MQIAHRIKRNRFEEDDDALLLAGKAHAFAQHHRRIRPVRWTGENDAGNIAQHGNRIVVVEMPAEPLLVTEPRNAHHHRIGVLSVGKEGQRCRLAAQLVFRIVQIGEELNLRHRREPVLRHADGEAQDRLLVEQRVDHPVGAEAGNQLLRHAIDAALAAHILAHQHDLAMVEHQIGQRPVDQPAHDLRLFHRLDVGAEGFGPHLGGGSVGRPAITFRRNEACHHLACRLQLGPCHRFFCNARDPFVGLVIDRQRVLGCQCARLIE